MVQRSMVQRWSIAPMENSFISLITSVEQIVSFEFGGTVKVG
jgi:hypothetical protein